MCERDGQRTRENQLLGMLLLVQSPLESQSEEDEFEPQGVNSMQGDLAQPRLKMLVRPSSASFLHCHFTGLDVICSLTCCTGTAGLCRVRE